jgi:PBP1b-binding outer membrane lipoprotein LpoB
MGINIKDFKDAAGTMVESLMVSGALDSVTGRKARIGVGHIVNDSGEFFDTDQIMAKITTDLMKTGKTETMTTFGSNAIDQVGKGTQQQIEFMEDKKISGNLPDFTLAGKIMRTTAREGSVREVAYTFQLYLTNVRTGAAAWQDEKIISKQTKRPVAGF